MNDKMPWISPYQSEWRDLQNYLINNFLALKFTTWLTSYLAKWLVHLLDDWLIFCINRLPSLAKCPIKRSVSFMVAWCTDSGTGWLMVWLTVCLISHWCTRKHIFLRRLQLLTFPKTKNYAKILTIFVLSIKPHKIYSSKSEDLLHMSNSNSWHLIFYTQKPHGNLRTFKHDSLKN